MWSLRSLLVLVLGVAAAACGDVAGPQGTPDHPQKLLVGATDTVLTNWQLDGVISSSTPNGIATVSRNLPPARGASVKCLAAGTVSITGVGYDENGKKGYPEATVDCHDQGGGG